MAPFDMERQRVSPIAVFNIENKKMHRVAMFLLHPTASKNVEGCFFLRVDVYQVRHLIKQFLSRVEEKICLGFSNEILPFSLKCERAFYKASLGENGCYKLVNVAANEVGSVSQYLSIPYTPGIWNWGC